ncbi:MAG TPA: bifunctional 5,10-methylenetetrahydrofolate dehydrogenase/5,10-methenyltetrahydrofolate cyclohydrolase [Saprospiraceae bacterium]|nr:bifunctional 5,10-methylenetetrahydrofolate dehydrogenase/5,10-methenyltetrahydrofolate cyclohydrolase [Saprospiraceae bacterium]HQW55807.1 bifunctional 5,10-methylenetetrahydrofolate dehydrogenase/5,10-methenyltetrahydrofolate cyclohydrolase [Saprospiraceae bacterium]
MAIIDVREISKNLKEGLRNEVNTFLDNGMRKPHLSAIMVGNNPASGAYVRNKVKSCDEVGFKSSVHHLDETTTQHQLLELINSLNQDIEVDGFILQLPLPVHLDAQELLAAIDPDKDVDGFHPMNVGKMVLGLDGFLPATPYGIMMLLEELDVQTAGKKCVILGRSDIVGTPMAILMSRKGKHQDATVTLLHSKSKNMQQELLQAEIIVAAIGIPNFVKTEMVSPGAVVIDVGINQIKDPSTKKGYRLTGDVDFETIKDKASFITPVPGGVGLMTIMGLMKNTLKAYKNTMNAE